MHASDGSRIAHLGELDAIKLKAEGCVEKLNEAEKLDNLRLQVENAFRSDDLAQMAQSLRAFRGSLVRSFVPAHCLWHCDRVHRQAQPAAFVYELSCPLPTGCCRRAAPGQAIRGSTRRVDGRCRGEGGSAA